MRAIALIAMFLIVVSGCTSLKTADNQSTEVAVSNLSVGDSVKITTADGNHYQFTIEAIEDDALIGDGVRVLKDEIQAVAVEQIDPAKTAIAGGSIAAGVVVILSVISSAFVGVLAAPP